MRCLCWVAAWGWVCHVGVMPNCSKGSFILASSSINVCEQTPEIDVYADLINSTVVLGVGLLREPLYFRCVPALSLSRHRM